MSIALDLLDLGESGIGLLGAVLGVGGLLGGFVALVLGVRQRIATDFGAGIVMWSAPLLLVAVWPTLASALFAMFLIGVANSLVDVNAYTLIQRIAPAEVMGRVFGALESVVIAGMALGSFLMAVLIATVGLRWGLVVIGASVATLAVAGLAGLRRIDTHGARPAWRGAAASGPDVGGAARLRARTARRRARVGDGAGRRGGGRGR